MSFELSLDDALAVTLHAFFTCCPSAHVTVEVFVQHAANVCNEKQIKHLEQFISASDVMQIGSCSFSVSKGVIRGLRAKNAAVDIRFVTLANFDEVYNKFEEHIGNSRMRVHYSHLYSSRARIQALRASVAALQMQLAEKTFQIIAEDHARYKEIKMRDKNIEAAKRTARRNERQLR